MTRLVLLAAAFVGLLATPLLLRPSGSNAPASARATREVVIVTPNNEQIRYEFARAFRTWHEKNYGEPADVLWSTPGGAVEIRRMLTAAWESRLRQGLEVGGDADLIFGGGSYEFDTLKKPVSVTVGGETKTATILEPVELPAALVQGCYEMTDIAGQKLYDPKGYWYGVALSTFGIVMNLQVLEHLHVEPLKTWSDLADPRLFGWISIVNPSQSGSVLTAFEAITQQTSWLDGLAILRRTAANARGFAASSPRVSIDVAAGDAAAGITIDFNARFQTQTMIEAAVEAGRPGTEPQVIFIAPLGQSSVDPDPVAMLRNPPHRETAIRFMEFCLSKDAQRLWQFRQGTPGGPGQFELRRMPVMRSLYTSEMAQFIDQVDPVAIATAPKVDNSSMRSFIPLLFQTMAMDSHKDLKAAWQAIAAHPAYPKENHGLVRASDVSDPQLKSWLEKFDALPTMATPEGPRPLGDIDNLKMLRDGWLRGEWKDKGLWPEQNAPTDSLRRIFAPYFQENYQWIVDQAASHKAA
ncbi:MAG: extracellular solute-binding protein [Planctomycetes bacterium]|nr:extracellular solute-binding protein [Planctomycetota bacterium]